MERSKGGNRGLFHGQRREFLERWVEPVTRYYSGSEKTPKHRVGSGKNIFDQLYGEYWDRFPPGVPITHEPPVDPTALAKYAREPTDPKELEQWTAQIESTKKSIKSWFERKRTRPSGANVFDPLLKQLRQPQSDPPRRQQPAQVYMRRPQVKERLNAEFERLGYKSRPAEDHINLRCEIAREWLQNEPATVREELQAEIEAKYQADMAKFQDQVEGLPSLDPAEQAEARRRMAVTFRPCIDQLSAYTGYHLFIFGVRIDEKLDVDITCIGSNVNTESPAYRDFTRAKPDAYATVGRCLTQFVADIRQLLCLDGSAKKTH
uniref:Uncharacterized protein n=1 Tax=Mycena chlorophos TaxID=658473 RepID=A0ABQ0L3A4_MYCCL|nr:predicted protein [Mycena chlorophos]